MIGHCKVWIWPCSTTLCEEQRKRPQTPRRLGRVELVEPDCLVQEGHIAEWRRRASAEEQPGITTSVTTSRLVTQ